MTKIHKIGFVIIINNNADTNTIILNILKNNNLKIPIYKIITTITKELKNILASKSAAK